MSNNKGNGKKYYSNSNRSHGREEPQNKKNQSSTLCKHFKEGSCRQGSNCKFSHGGGMATKGVHTSTPVKPDKNRACADFQCGSCRFGSSCRFSHNSETFAKLSTSVSGEQNISSDVRDYWGIIQKTFKDSSRNQENFRISDFDLWQDVWRAAATSEIMPQLSRFVLVRAYLSATHRSVLDPPIKIVVKVLNEILSKEVQTAQSPQFLCRHVLDVCKNRLQPSLSSRDTQPDKLFSGLNLQEIQEELDKLWDEFTKCVSQINNKQLSSKDKQSLMNDAKCFSEYQDELVSVFNNSILLKSSAIYTSPPIEELKPWQGWKHHPTLNWLMKADWMKEFPSERLDYSSPTEYAESMLKTWTILTFYWGSGAVWPLCTHKCPKPNAKAEPCGQPLLMSTSHSNNSPCSMTVIIDGRTQSCQKPAAWKCHFHRFNHHIHQFQHDSICNDCLTRRQQVLIGENRTAEYKSSTDIYDACVEKEIHRNGQSIMLLSHTASRKPALQPPNWRTTYRLQSSALVAVVRVARERQSLEPSMPVYWAEVVPFIQSKDHNLDFRHKSKGEIAVRFLSNGDCADLKIAQPSLEKGCRVVVIDLRVFVPEVVSVLSAMASNSFVQHMHSIPFIQHLIGTSDITRAVSKQREASIPLVVTKAIFESDMECIKKLNNTQKEEISSGIYRLRAVKSLYGTQLDAFADALKFQVHCIQGPPGTGKSYVGVCLVLSLLVIRKVVKAAGFPLGPIVTLSYKNHALDEFLCDILEFDSDLKQPGKLIRAGNTDNINLSGCSESRSREEKKAIQDLNVILEYHKTVRTVCKDWKRCAQHFNTLSCLPEMDAQQQEEWKPEIVPDYPESSAFNYSMGAVLFAVAVSSDIYIDEIDDNTDEECKALIQEIKCSCNISTIKSIDSILCVEDLKPWYEEVEHWRPTNPSSKKSTEYTFFSLLQFYISHWIRGKYPPPRCQYYGADDVQCMECAAPNVPYCPDHRCQGTGGSCIEPRLPSFDFCPSHICSYALCKSERMDDTIAFCCDHSCPVCVRTNPSDVRCLVANITSTCKTHRCNVPSCHNIQLYPSKFCEMHSCAECLRFGEPCKVPSKKYGLCSSHRCAAENCSRPRAFDCSTFCIDHTCRVCIKNDVTLVNIALSPTPRNTCRDHPLCEFVLGDGSICSASVSESGSSMYCIQHSTTATVEKEEGDMIVDQCCGITSRNKRCKSSKEGVGYNWFCSTHEIQRPAKQSTETKDEGRAITEEGVYISKMEEFQSRAKFQVLNCSFANKTSACQCTTKFLVDISQVPASEQLCWAHQFVPKQKKVHPLKDAALIVEPLEDPQPIIIAGKLDSKVTTLPVKKDPAIGIIEKFSAAEKSTPSMKGEIVDVIEDIDVADAGAAVDPDEMELSHLNQQLNIGFASDGTLKSTTVMCDEDINDERLHLREIGGEDDDDAAGVEEEDDEYDDDRPEEELLSPYELLQTWNWQMNRNQRLQAAANLLMSVSNLVEAVREKTQPALDRARKDCAEAGAQAMKRARIVGATVVGASRRLPAIRAAEPFAIVVEEACEVMEPTLMSVLAIRSLHKLVLVGDHRQLPAFVQNTWYNLEMSHPCLKVSLFERLIKLSKSARLSMCTVLDEQRRMRRCIADITRGEYKTMDNITIIDHPITATQRIGDRVPATSDFVNEKSLWVGGGRRVPGIQSAVYFWDINKNMENGRSNRPVAGISPCNEVEAKAVMGLIKYLCVCGVPASSITVITPYKGQKMLMSKYLRNESIGDDVIVSTVDRFQGDENDIVILSMVRTVPGNRFILLANRFIVALSRARLGSFVVGSVSAVTTDRLSHWDRFISSLRAPLSADDPESCGFEEERVGALLPICCPRHLTTRKQVITPSEFPAHGAWNRFCKERCPFVLPCQHFCAVGCHSPSHTPHTKKCLVEIPSPCSTHKDLTILCYELKMKIGESVGAAKSRFECQVMVPYRRPDCPHTIALPCHQYQRCIRGEVSPPVCAEIVSDYVHPECGHVFSKPTCKRKREWEQSPPTCRIPITFSRSCKCTLTFECHEYLAERKLPIQPTCFESVTIQRPRCLHKLSMRCHEAQTLLARWNSQIGDSASMNKDEVVVVKYGKGYGPSESDIMTSIARCSNSVVYQQSCGHEVKNILCCEAFDYAARTKASGRCEVKLKSKCLCQGQVTLPCWTWSFVNSIQYQQQGDQQHQDVSTILLDENFVLNRLVHQIKACQPTPEILKAVENVCKSTISIERCCGKTHLTKMACGSFFGELIRSTILSKRMTFSECEWPISDIYTYSCGTHTKEVKQCNIFRQLMREKPFCKSKVLAKLHRCGHCVSVDCCDKQKASAVSEGRKLCQVSSAEAEAQPLVECSVIYCIPSADVPVCDGKVRFQFDICGHVRRDVPCAEAFRWVDNPPFCTEMTSMKHPICFHDSEIPCYLRRKLLHWSPWKEGNPPHPEHISIDASATGQAIHLPLIRERDQSPPAAPPGVSKEETQWLICKIPTMLHRTCGCDVRVLCSEAYRFKGLGECQEIKTHTCADCHLEKQLHCHELRRQEKAGAFDPCANILSKRCSVCKINECEIPCSVSLVTCNRQVEGELSCGHFVSWECGTDPDPRFDESFVCLGCEIPRWKNLLDSTVPTADKSDFFIAIHKRIERCMYGVYAIENEEPISLSIDNHIQSLVLYFRKLVDLIEKKKVRPQRAPAKLLAVEDVHKYYRVVFKPCHDISHMPHEEGLKALATSFSQPIPTPYGHGVHINSFSQQQMELVKPPDNGDDGVIAITVGVAFCFNQCIQPPPFTAEKDMKKMNAENIKKVNKRAVNFQEAGFDCVSIGEHNQELVCWIPG